MQSATLGSMADSGGLHSRDDMHEIKTLHTLPARLKDLGARPAIVAFAKDRKEQWSYPKLAGQSARLATGITESGIEKGDSVALVAENRPEWIAACLGVVSAGAVAVPIDAQLAGDALTHVLRDSEARLVFTTERLVKRVKQAIGRRRCDLILLGKAAEAVRGWEDLQGEPGEPAVAVSPEDRAVLFYTSGTTGPPKGVPLTHQNLAFQLNSIAAAHLVTD